LVVFCTIRDAQAVYYERRDDDYMADKAYNTERLVHFESVRGGRDIQHDHADHHTHAIEEQTVRLHHDGAAVHRDGHQALDEPRQAQT